MTQTKLAWKKLLLREQMNRVQFEREQKLTHKYSMIAIEFGAIIFGMIIIMKIFL